MRHEIDAVLGIDAAWTDTEPSGVALLRRHGSTWRCLRVAPSYRTFCSHFTWSDDLSGVGQVSDLLAMCRNLLDGATPAVVAVDMPMALTRIVGRREADDEVSRRFGGCKCSTHSPSPTRPGATGRLLQHGFSSQGYALATTGNTTPALIEVYPHVALLGLTQRKERLPYKVGKTGRYWPDRSASDRKELVCKQLKVIRSRLVRQIEAVKVPLPSNPSEHAFNYLKRFEDALDAIVCAWMGSQFLAGVAVPLGNETAAIWVPHSAMRFAEHDNAE